MPMESEGPRPYLKAKRRETAAEQMSRQQSEFEDRSGPVRDEAEQAATHNETHPKLKKQLDKRRSVTEFQDLPVKRTRVTNSDYDDERGSTGSRRYPNYDDDRDRGIRPYPDYDDDRGSRRYPDYDRDRGSRRYPDYDDDRGSRHYRRRQYRRKPDRPRRPRARNRVAKRRERRPCTCSKCLKKPLCRKNVANLCVYVVNRRIGTDTLPQEEKGSPGLEARKSISKHSVGHHTPASTNPSVSSYNSFDSSDHPPVV